MCILFPGSSYSQASQENEKAPMTVNTHGSTIVQTTLVHRTSTVVGGQPHPAEATDGLAVNEQAGPSLCLAPEHH